MGETTRTLSRLRWGVRVWFADGSRWQFCADNGDDAHRLALEMRRALRKGHKVTVVRRWLYTCTKTPDARVQP
jgi:hypothetical protein